jgi:hypothetical protein
LVRRMRRSSLWLFVLTLAAVAPPLRAQTPAGGVAVKTYTGYFNDTAVYFTAFETNSLQFAQANQLVYAPRLTYANRAVVPTMLFFPNVAPPQTTVLQTQPGFGNYNPIWEVLTAYWRGPGPMPLITSYAAAVQWNKLGKLVVYRTGILFNGPVVWINMTLNRLGGRLAPTISPVDFLGINPAQRAVYFRSMPGYYNGQVTAFLGLEHAPGEIAEAPGAIPVPTIGTNYLGHNAIANFYVVQGQEALPVLDSFPQGTTAVTPVTNPPGTVVTPYSIQGKPAQTPPPQGTGQTGQTGQQGGQTGQQGGQQPVPGYPPATQPVGGYTGGTQPVAGDQGSTEPSIYAGGTTSPSYATLYSPIWHVHHVAFRPGVPPRLLRSLQEIQQAASLGWVTVTPGGVYETFNCPVITALQPYNPVSPGGGYTPPPPGGYTPPPGGGGGYTPVTPSNPIPVTPTPGTGY